jgi:peptide-methionine (R)-S-oxide reductase
MFFKTKAPERDFPIQRSEAEWREILSPMAYKVLREHATERAGTSPLNQEKRAGMFHCAGCGTPLFDAATKFESGTGWPSFTSPVAGNVGEQEDNSFFMRRTEVHCAVCGGHLGHVFPDGPAPTGLRYCINGAALTFEPEA